MAEPAEGRISLILTVLNEAGSLERLLRSLAGQRRPPDEVVAVDGGSTDGTLEILRRAAEELPFPLRILERPGAGIAAGRNSAVRAARHDWIACTDAGVRLDPDWLEALLHRLREGAPAVAGVFRADPRTPFELALGVTTLPLPEELDPRRFLPSSRSVAFTRRAWEAAGGYPEWLDHSEDVVFDLRIRERVGPFAWAPAAVAHFRPRSGLAAFARQYFRYARGDGQARLWTGRHLLRYGVYLIGLSALLRGGPLGWLALLAGGLLYLRRPLWRLARTDGRWSAAQRLQAALWIPLIRLTGDAAKMLGYPTGLAWRVARGDQAPPPVRGRGSAGGRLL